MTTCICLFPVRARLSWPRKSDNVPRAPDKGIAHLDPLATLPATARSRQRPAADRQNSLPAAASSAAPAGRACPHLPNGQDLAWKSQKAARRAPTMLATPAGIFARVCERLAGLGPGPAQHGEPPQCSNACRASRAVMVSAALSLPPPRRSRRSGSVGPFRRRKANIGSCAGLSSSPISARPTKSSSRSFKGTAPMVREPWWRARSTVRRSAVVVRQRRAAGQTRGLHHRPARGRASRQLLGLLGGQGRSAIKSIADMKGKSVGTNVFGSGILGPMFLLLKTQWASIPQKDIKLVETGFPGSEDAIRARAASMSACSTSRSRRAPRPRVVCASCLRSPISSRTSCTSWRCAAKEFVDKNGELVKNYVRDLTAGMTKALADRAGDAEGRQRGRSRHRSRSSIPISLKANDFAREPGAAPELRRHSGHVRHLCRHRHDRSSKLDVGQFRHPSIVAPLELGERNAGAVEVVSGQRHDR